MADSLLDITLLAALRMDWISALTSFGLITGMDVVTIVPSLWPNTRP